MAREKKGAKSFACIFNREMFEKPEEFCEMSGQSKTLVVERAMEKYLEGNLGKMREFSKKL